MSAENVPKRNSINSKSRMPESSFLFERIIPAPLVLMGILTILLILFAAGVLLTGTASSRKRSLNRLVAFLNYCSPA